MNKKRKRNVKGERNNLKKNVRIVTDLDGKRVVLINDIIFKGKRNINWKDVEIYLKKYVSEFYEIADTKDIVYIGNDLPDEYANSNYTHCLKGASAKAKANAAQGIPEMIEIAFDKKYEKNRKEKHTKDAKYGWYRYATRFALPILNEDGIIEKYNVFQAIMLIRHARDDKMYLYDVIEIKKETSKLFQLDSCTQ